MIFKDTLSANADVIQDDFKQYFGTYIPVLVNLLTTVSGDT